ncbi:hypothetical protein MMC25_002636 [Agyrium rufum]|nr:hypothetical protein [Agyrium rufum]
MAEFKDTTTMAIEKRRIFTSGDAGTLKKFSDFLTSPIFSIVVEEEPNARTYLLHSALLARESDTFAIDVYGDFMEKDEQSIKLLDEDPALFGFFVEFMYQNAWVKEDVKRAKEFCVLARLYCLAERLQAQNFQQAALHKFTKSFGGNNSGPRLNEKPICELLDIVCSELPERTNGDPLRDQVFWLAAREVESLRQHEYFKELLSKHVDLGRYLILRADNSRFRQPNKPSYRMPTRLEPESL